LVKGGPALMPSPKSTNSGCEIVGGRHHVISQSPTVASGHVFRNPEDDVSFTDCPNGGVHAYVPSSTGTIARWGKTQAGATKRVLSALERQQRSGMIV